MNFIFLIRYTQKRGFENTQTLGYTGTSTIFTFIS